MQCPLDVVGKLPVGGGSRVFARSLTGVKVLSCVSSTASLLSVS